MLDSQRQKYAPIEGSASVLFARRVIFAHLLGGLTVIALLLFHELFWAAMWAIAWFILTLFFCVGMTKKVVASRWLLSLLFLIAAVVGFGAMLWVLPGMKPEREPLLSLRAAPFWMVMASFAYGLSAYVLLVSTRVKTACKRGFTLMDTPKPY
jgi:hypothetical protein